MTEFPKDIKRHFNEVGEPFELILINDDLHDFDFVIEKLKFYCGHTPEQAEQAALITHQNGECSILLDSEDRIEKIKKKLAKEGLMVDSRKMTI